MKYKVGFGYDVHQLHDNLPFWLGGVLIPHEKGALGHSDADALIHAICDALLGAAGLGDIGLHFPDTSAEFKNIDSKIILARTVSLLKAKGYTISNIDSTICLQQPKIAPYIPEMRLILAQILEISPDDMSIKATTTEKLGFIGREQGVAAYAVVSVFSM